MVRGRICAVCAALLLCVGISVAQDAADIMVGGEVVARVREKGAYESVEHRAAAIDEAINQALASADDPATLEVTLEQIDGLWTVLIAGTKIMSVYPAEADSNGMAPEVLGAVWVRKLKDALPSASSVEVQEIGEPETAPAPAAVGTVGGQPTTAPAPVTDEGPATGAVTNTGAPAVEVLEVPSVESEPETIVAGQGARLLILEAFNNARDMPEDDYLVRREVIAEELFDNIVQVLTGGKSHGRISETGTSAGTLPTPPAPTPATTTTATTTEAPPPAGTTVETVTGAGTQPVVGPVTTTVGPTPAPAASYALSDERRQEIEAAIPADDPSYANVVQKVVIKAKFKAASEGYRVALSSDPATAAQAKEILTAARRSFTGGDYDLAESYLDTALGLLGVTEWEQHIGAAMAELGLSR